METSTIYKMNETVKRIWWYLLFLLSCINGYGQEGTEQENLFVMIIYSEFSFFQSAFPELGVIPPTYMEIITESNKTLNFLIEREKGKSFISINEIPKSFRMHDGTQSAIVMVNHGTVADYIPGYSTTWFQFIGYPNPDCSSSVRFS